MGTGDGTIVGTTKIVDNGPDADRYNLVLIAEGYQQSELTRFATDCTSFINHLFAMPPFDELQCAFNVYRVDVASDDSGADDPVACGGTGATPATYFDARFCNNGIRRLLLVNNTTVTTVANAQVPNWHMAIAIINSNVWGGAGGLIATTSTAAGWENIAIHEMGHTVFGLADEYEYWAGCGVDTTQNNYTGGEPTAPNITTDSNRNTNKWKDLVLASTPMPTTSNPNCAQCDTQPNPVSAGTVGAFEGAGYNHCGLYRPQYNCMMRNLNTFCAVCQRRIRQTLSPYMGDCYAPKFGAQNWLVCIFVSIMYIILIAFLYLFSWIPSVRCTIKQLQFRIQRCTKGNTSSCHEL